MSPFQLTIAPIVAVAESYWAAQWEWVRSQGEHCLVSTALRLEVLTIYICSVELRIGETNPETLL